MTAQIGANPETTARILLRELVLEHG